MGTSVSIADMPQQKVLGAFDSKEEMRSRAEEIGLLSATLGRNFDTDLELAHDQTPIAIAVTAAAGLSTAQPAMGQSDWSSTSIRYNGLHRSTRTASGLS